MLFVIISCQSVDLVLFRHCCCHYCMYMYSSSQKFKRMFVFKVSICSIFSAEPTKYW